MLATNTSLVTSAICWSEFTNGPVNEESKKLIASILKDQILPFSKQEAYVCSKIFNVTGRVRGTFIDCMIASIAIVNNAELWTENSKDFVKFALLGLQLN